MQNSTKQHKYNQKGQTLVEFILLLGGITIISFTFMNIINGRIATRWEKLANILLEDPNQTLKIK